MKPFVVNRRSWGYLTEKLESFERFAWCVDFDYHMIEIKVPHTEEAVSEVFDFAEVNTSHRWSVFSFDYDGGEIAIVYSNPRLVRVNFFFESEKDAALFKLWWK